MVSPIPGSTYLLASGGSLVPFTRYDLDGTHPVDSASFPDGEKSESFDWVDNNTIICNDYGANKQRLYLVDVTTTTGPDTLTLTKNLTWNGDGYVTTPVSTRIRNVRVGQTDPNYAYYGNNGVADNPKVYAIDLRTGASTELGHWDGTLRAGATASFGLWTVVERGGYLYLHTSDDGIQVYSMSGPTTMGAMVASYSPEQLRPITPIAGGGNSPFYGFDVAADGEGLILGDYVGDVFELQRRAPALSGGWQLRGIVQPHLDVNPHQGGNSTYNPRFFDGNIYATELSDATFRCFGYYDGASLAYLGGGIPAVNEHRMLGRLRSPGGMTYLMGTGGWRGDVPNTFAPTFTRYDSDYWASNPVAVNSIGDQVVESFDFVDDDTIISTCYSGTANKRKLYLSDVTADPFGLLANTTWNAEGWVDTGVSTRIRNVRVSQTYSGYAYFGDAGQNNSPGFYAINLATGVPTLLGNLGTLHGGGSWGLWTVVERGNYLYVQTTDNGIEVYGPMVNATSKGPLYATYTKAELDALTGIRDEDQYYGLDLSADAGKALLGAPFGKVYVLERKFDLSITKSGANVILSWPAYYAGAFVESSSTLEPGSFADLSPQPAKVAVGDRVTATVSIAPDVPAFFRLRN
jgi:hypothetical protein